MLNRSNFMQDGATPHTALTTRRYLKDIFGKRIIGKHFEYAWPSYSPDLTTADYWPTCTLKRVVYTLQWKTRTVHQYSVLEEGNYFRFQESKGSFTYYVIKFLAFFTPLPPSAINRNQDPTPLSDSNIT